MGKNYRTHARIVEPHFHAIERHFSKLNNVIALLANISDHDVLSEEETANCESKATEDAKDQTEEEVY